MRRLLALLLLLLPLAAPAQVPPDEAAYREVFSLEAFGPPNPSALAAAAFRLAYRGSVPNAAFALARDASGRSAWGYAGGAASPEAAEAAALSNCQRSLGPLQAECRVFARNAVRPGGPGIAPVEGGIGPFRWAPLLLHRGPEAARGVLVWGHGYGGPDRDLRNTATPPFVSLLNDNGWDVLRFDRHPGDDGVYASLPMLTGGLALLRQAGYRRILLGGQSRGGWQAIMAASERPDLVEAVIATAPAAHGEWTRGNNLGAAMDDFRRLLAGLPAGGPRLAVVVFDGDDFDPDPERRAAMLEAKAAERSAPTLALWPEPPLRGHGGAKELRFTLSYAGCLLSLVQAPEAAAPRGLRRAACTGG
ncbi:alpha/beta hydrolase [Paracraurococcus lichenis]|uniref:Alpha/beta hydrolase n=1 Tax=Paracraurococcus lichenis TaxID=3064888 RepID=A0ABT9E890_9PROT|nr:alpha/beta hydrolase [Paracraurococcus sp. LOR1-02]MDO9712170.1 alpha/beta hydrolase [Paracraurococcus sp. LOR1-02]